jgi:membrane AbrB-like protein
MALAGLPVGWLCGAMIAATALALHGTRFELPVILRDLAFVVLGLGMGAGLSPDRLTDLMRWPLSIAALILTMPLIVGAVMLFLERGAGWNRGEALVSAVPGALSSTLAFTAAAGLDVRRVAILQTLRVFLLVLLIPLATTGTDVAPAAAADSAAMSLLPMGAMALGGAGVAYVLARLHVPAPTLLGGFGVSGLLHGTGMLAAPVPALAMNAAFVVTGVLVGSRFTGISVRDLVRILGLSLVAFLIVVAISAVVSLAVARLLGLPTLQVLLAFAPGGFEVMVILAFALGYEPAFVATHHLVRFLAIVLLLPFVFRWLTRRPPK